MSRASANMGHVVGRINPAVPQQETDEAEKPPNYLFAYEGDDGFRVFKDITKAVEVGKSLTLQRYRLEGSTSLENGTSVVHYAANGQAATGYRM